MGRAPLSCFPIIETVAPEEMRAALVREAGVRAFDLPNGPDGFYGRGNHVQLKSVGLSYCNYGAATRIAFPEARAVRHQIAFSGIGKTTTGTTESLVTPQQSRIISADVEYTSEYSAGYEHLVLWIDSDSLARHLVALLGFQPKEALRFEPTGDFQRPEMQSFRRFVMFFANELELTYADPPKQLIAELEETLIAASLFSNRHSFSDLLAMPTAQIAPWQVRLVEEHIEANWNQAISVEGLAAITGASVRSIFNSFKRSRGYSPMVFLKQVRIRHANEMLGRPDASTSVTGVAFACGFHNLGHFARDYRAVYGELPSETLKRSIGRAQKSD